MDSTVMISRSAPSTLNIDTAVYLRNHKFTILCNIYVFSNHTVHWTYGESVRILSLFKGIMLAYKPSMSPTTYLCTFIKV